MEAWKYYFPLSHSLALGKRTFFPGWGTTGFLLTLGASGNWIEIAYGTSSGAVRVIVQHPETVGSGPQLFQTFTVHRSPVTKIMLSEKHLVSGNLHKFLLVDLPSFWAVKCLYALLYNLICSHVGQKWDGQIWGQGRGARLAWILFLTEGILQSSQLKGLGFIWPDLLEHLTPSFVSYSKVALGENKWVCKQMHPCQVLLLWVGPLGLVCF